MSIYMKQTHYYRRWFLALIKSITITHEKSGLKKDLISLKKELDKQKLVVERVIMSEDTYKDIIEYMRIDTHKDTH